MLLAIQAATLLSLLPMRHALLAPFDDLRHPRQLRRLWRDGRSSLCVLLQPSILSTRLFDSSEALFDFSSTIGWEQYYRDHPSTSENDEWLEWHSSIPLNIVAGYCSTTDDGSVAGDVLMIGCGTSRLPEAVLERGSTTTSSFITLLDSSQTCIDQMKERYKHQERIGYVCGDAVKLSDTLLIASEQFDVIVDKGLMDALLCGEGWNGPVATLLEEASQKLRCKGVYVLVSYRLPRSTREYLTEVGDRVGLTWEFDCKGSNDRVGVSIARKDE